MKLSQGIEEKACGHAGARITKGRAGPSCWTGHWWQRHGPAVVMETVHIGSRQALGADTVRSVEVAAGTQWHKWPSYVEGDSGARQRWCAAVARMSTCQLLAGTTWINGEEKWAPERIRQVGATSSQNLHTYPCFSSPPSIYWAPVIPQDCFRS